MISTNLEKIQFNLDNEGLCIYDPTNQINHVKIWMDNEGFLCIDPSDYLQVRKFNLTDDNVIYRDTNPTLIED